MKKKLIVLGMLFAVLAISVNAKIINVAQNTTEGSALAVDFGDTIVINGTMPWDGYFYKIYVPYNGTVTCNVHVEKISGPDYIDEADFTLRFGGKSNYPSMGHNDSGYIKYSVKPGNYYFCVDPYYGYNSLDYFRFTFVFNFECSHIETKETIEKQPTCSEYGEKREICSECKEVINTEKIEKLPHTPNEEWIVTKETSCSADGLKVLNCSVCEEQIEEEKIDALPHTFSDWETTKETSCKEPGEKVRVCSVCSFKENEEIEQLPHSFGEWTVEKQATCSETGLRSRICSVCQKVEKDDIDKENHTYGNWTIVEQATCKQEGLRTRTCSVCSHEEDDEIEKKEHRFSSWKTEKNATETSKGKQVRTCADCREEETSDIPKLVCGAEYTWKTITEVTCTTSGSRKKICSYCGKTLKTETVNAYGHDYGKWEVIITPTKNSNGTESRVCDLCGKSETRSVTLTHGEYGEWKVTKEATCKETGVKSFVCFCCDKTTKTNTISKTAHTYGTWTETTPTPEKNGKKERKCTVCGEAQSETVKYSFEDFKKKPEKTMPFKDIKSDAWYKSVVGKCYHYSLMVGNSESTFNPTGNITIAEVITSAVRIYCLYNPDSEKPVVTENPWYKGYVDFAIKKNIIKSSDFDDYAKPATRAQMAYIFANCAGGDALTAINNYSAIPDVKNTHKYAKEIFKLYNAGILSGNDAQGTFFPEKNIIRAEAAAIIARISNISDRVKQQKA